MVRILLIRSVAVRRRSVVDRFFWRKFAFIIISIQASGAIAFAKNIKKSKVENLDPSTQLQYENFKSEASKIQSIYAGHDTDQIRHTLSEIQVSSDQLMSKTMHESLSQANIKLWMEELNKSVDTLIALSPKLRDLAPKLQNEFVLPFAEFQSKSYVSLSCETHSNQACENISDWTAEITRLNNHLYHARSYSVNDLAKENNALKMLLQKYDETLSPELLEKISNHLTKTVSKVQEQVANILPAFEISDKMLASK